MRPKILPATVFDIAHLAGNMRESDVREVKWMTAWTGRPYQPLKEMMDAASEHTIWSMWDGDVFMGCIGVLPVGNSLAGVIWFLGTEEADRRPVALFSGCRAFVEVQKHKFSWLGNTIPPHLVERRRWLERLGFDKWSHPVEPPSHEPVVFWQQAHDGPEEVARPR